MLFLSPSDYKIMPWKNGGGTTTEIAIYPENTVISSGSFIWRVSIAEVASNGPFSRFPNYDRHIMLIAGNGMVLDAGSAGKIVLDRLYEPASFSGDWLIEGALKAGPVRDFNVISARKDVEGSSLNVQVLTNRAKLATQNDNLLVYLLQGELSAAGRVVAETEAIILSPNESLDFSPLAGKAILALARIALK
jgi:environmental stress-induced protein Ves